MKILLTGKNGQVGFELSSYLSKLGIGELLAVGRKECNLNDVDAIRYLIRNYQPNIIINTAAYTAVDKAESEKILVKAINEVAPHILAEEAEKLGSLLVHFSTDYIFDGTKKGAYLEEDQPNPLNFYGTTKLAGELAIKNNCTQYLILRTSWVVGSHGNNFIKKILDLALNYDKINVVNDQFGAPTSSKLLSNFTVLLINFYLKQKKLFPFGLYHLTASGITNWYEFACYVINRAYASKNFFYITTDKIRGVRSSEYKSEAKRPANSVLDTSKIKKFFNIKIPSWQMGIDEIIDDICNEK